MISSGRRVAIAIAFLGLLTAAGCVRIREIRTEFPAPAQIKDTTPLSLPTSLPPDCNVGSPESRENRDVFEDYGSYELGFAEFDDQGWSYEGDRQLAAIKQRLHAELTDPAYHDMDFVTLVFVHGWHHNAHDNDCNVQEVRQMLRIASEKFEAARQADPSRRRRRVFGIYVGWRGEAVNAWLLRYTTILDRRDAAEKVAKGSVRQLLADLHEQQLVAQNAAGDRKTEAERAARMYTIVVGHSFGGLIVFNSLSQQLITDLTAAADQACTPAEAVGETRPWPDNVVLVNPAFESTRFEPLNRLADRAAQCGYAPAHPLLTVVTADDDRWTGPVFTAGRSVLTLFEGYDDSSPQARNNERNANIHAIGFVDRYRTHRLCLHQGANGLYATASAMLTPQSTANPQTVDKRAVWVVGAPPDIVYGHDGFLYARKTKGSPQPYLLEWLVATHVSPADAVSAPDSCPRWP